MPKRGIYKVEAYKYTIITVLILLSILMVLGLVDILGIDECLASMLFNVPMWDLNFFSLATLLTGISIPIVVATLSIAYQESAVSTIRAQKVVEFTEALGDIDHYLNAMFDRLQTIPDDAQKEHDHYRKQYSDYAEKHNKLIHVYPSLRVLVNDLAVEKTYDEFMKLVTETIIDWEMAHFEQAPWYEQYNKARSNYLQKAPTIVKQLNKLLSDLV